MRVRGALPLPLGVIAIVALGGLLALPASARAQGVPPSGAHLNPTTGHWYFDIEVVDFEEARAIAGAVGGYVVSILDAAEQQWLVGQFTDWTYCTGLTDEGSLGTYAWESGEPVLFTDWAPNQPEPSAVPQFARRLSDWQSRPFDGCTFAIIEVETPIVGPIPTIACAATNGGIQIDWDAPGFDQVQIRRDGQVLPGHAATSGSAFDPAPPGPHRYLLVATGPMGTSRPVQCDGTVPDPNHALRIPDAAAPHPGPIQSRMLLDNLGAVQGFSYGVCYDTAALELGSVTQGAALYAVSPQGADFFEVLISSNGYALGTVISFFDTAWLPPGSGQELSVATFETLLPGPVHEILRPCAEIGSPPVNVVVVVADVAIFPERYPGTLRLGLEDFRRGDGNVDGSVDIADVLFLGLLLFDPTVNDYPCREAFEANGDAQIDIADMIYTLAYLFGGGAPPGAPFPGCGHDPDLPDGFPCDTPSPCP